MDVALHRCGVTFVLDRAGVTGDDGASHNGMWDMSILQVVPGPAARRAARRAPGCASCSTRPSRSTTPRPCVRFPKGPPPEDIAGGRQGRRRRRARPQRHQGRPGRRRRLDGRRRASTSPSAWSPRASASPSSTRAGCMPVDPALVDLAREHRLVVSIEDNGRVGGVRLGAAADAQRRRRRRRRSACTASRRSSSTTPSARSILERIGLTPQALALGIVEDMTALAEGAALVDADRPA